MDYLAICTRAIGTLQRRGVCVFVERDELMAEGCLALSTRKPDTDALAVKIARDAMIDAVRRNERRNRGRVEVRSGHGADVNGDEVSDGDQWDATVYGKQNLRPDNTHTDLWDAMKALPTKQYRALTLCYWGGVTQGEAAVELGVSQPRVAQILAAAKKNLQDLLINRKPRAVTNMGGDLPVFRNKVPDCGEHAPPVSTKTEISMKLLSLSDVAQRLGVSEKTARQFKAELPGVVRVGRRIKYTEEAISDFIRSGGCRPAVEAKA